MSPPKMLTIIASHQRPDSLGKTLGAIFESSLLPSKIIICDSSDDENHQLVRQQIEAAERYLGIRLELIRSEIPSAAMQRNMAIELVDLSQYDYVQIIDDDTRPTRNHNKKIVDFLHLELDFVGASGCTPSTKTEKTLASLPQAAAAFAFRLFGLEGKKEGSVTLACVGLPVGSSNEKTHVETEWLYGCATWRSKVLEDIRFNDRLRGGSLFDDVELSVRAAQKGKLAVIPSAVLEHDLSPIGRENRDLFLFRFNRNRFLVAQVMNFKALRFFSIVASGVFLATVEIWFFVRGQGAIHVRNANAALKGLISGIRNEEPR